MNQRVIDEWRRRSLCNGWTFYLWAVSLTLATVAVAYLTLRRGLAAMLDEPSTFYLLGFCAIMAKRDRSPMIGPSQWPGCPQRRQLKWRL